MDSKAHLFFNNIGEYHRFLLIISTIFCWIFFSLSEYPSIEIKKEITSYNKLVTVYEEIGFLFPKIVLSQTILETGWGTSAISRSPIFDSTGNVILTGSNNLVGMKRNNRGYSVTGRGNPEKTPNWCQDKVHACYTDPIKSLRDYKSWQDERLATLITCGGTIPTTAEEYFSFLENLPFEGKYGCYYRRYATDKKYISKIRIIYNKLTEVLTNTEHKLES